MGRETSRLYGAGAFSGVHRETGDVETFYEPDESCGFHRHVLDPCLWWTIDTEQVFKWYCKVISLNER